MNPKPGNQFDKIITGWLIGTIAPIIVFILVYFVKFSETELMIWIKNIWQMKIFMKLLSLCIVPNLGFFMIFYRKKFDSAARGVILATFIYAFLFLLMKL
jgi:hypothetical protein